MRQRVTFPEVETTFAWVESVMNRVKIPPTLCRSYFTTFSVASYKHSARFAHLYVSIAILGTKHAFPVSISMLNQEQLFWNKTVARNVFWSVQKYNRDIYRSELFPHSKLQ